jgi:acetate kinase
MPQNGKSEYRADIPFPTHREAIEAVLEKLVSPEYGVVESMDEIGAVGHRVLHGGSEFTESCLVDDECEAAIKKCFPLGPLHNPANLMGIKACQAVMSGHAAGGRVRHHPSAWYGAQGVYQRPAL